MRWRAMKAAVLTAAQDCDLIHIQTPFAAHYAGLAAAGPQAPRVGDLPPLFEEYFQHYAPWLPVRWLRALARSFRAASAMPWMRSSFPRKRWRDDSPVWGRAPPPRAAHRDTLANFGGGDGEKNLPAPPWHR